MHMIILKIIFNISFFVLQRLKYCRQDVQNNQSSIFALQLWSSSDVLRRVADVAGCWLCCCRLAVHVCLHSFLHPPGRCPDRSLPGRLHHVYVITLLEHGVGVVRGVIKKFVDCLYKIKTP